jgi:hypothetical protein
MSLMDRVNADIAGANICPCGRLYSLWFILSLVPTRGRRNQGNSSININKIFFIFKYLKNTCVITPLPVKQRSSKFILTFFIFIKELSTSLLLHECIPVKQQSSKLLSPKWDIPHGFGSRVWIIRANNFSLYGLFNNPTHHSAIFYVNT